MSSVDPSFPTDMNSFIDLGSEGIKRAGHIVENSDQVIAFWDAKSRGTKNSIDRAKTKKIPLTIHYF